MALFKFLTVAQRDSILNVAFVLNRAAKPGEELKPIKPHVNSSCYGSFSNDNDARRSTDNLSVLTVLAVAMMKMLPLSSKALGTVSPQVRNCVQVSRK